MALASRSVLHVALVLSMSIRLHVAAFEAPTQQNVLSGNEDGECVGGHHPGVKDAIAAVVTVAFNRTDYLKRHLESLMAVHNSSEEYRTKFPLFISQDGREPDQTVAQLALSHEKYGVHYLHHKEEAPPKTNKGDEDYIGFYRISNHYRFIMRIMFECFGFAKLIILEEDMELAPDFFSYFEATAPLLESDASLYCISSWNDNGHANHVKDPLRLYRTDFFPGLGWMLSDRLWFELRDKWPRAFWDDWMRLPNARKGRQCIYPEVCRNYNFGDEGNAVGAEFFKAYLESIRLNNVSVDWSSVHLAYLAPHRYAMEMYTTLARAPVVSTLHEAIGSIGNVQLHYHSEQLYHMIARRLGIFDNFSAGVPRGSYHGIVIVHVGNASIFLVPASSFHRSVGRAQGREKRRGWHARERRFLHRVSEQYSL